MTNDPLSRPGRPSRARRWAPCLLAALFLVSPFVDVARAEDGRDNWGHRDERPNDQDWRRRNNEGRGHWNGGYYREPPVVYSAPYQYPAYYPPPVVYERPGLGIYLPGLGIQIH